MTEVVDLPVHLVGFGVQLGQGLLVGGDCAQEAVSALVQQVLGLCARAAGLPHGALGARHGRVALPLGLLGLPVVALHFLKLI